MNHNVVFFSELVSVKVQTSSLEMLVGLNC